MKPGAVIVLVLVMGLAQYEQGDNIITSRTQENRNLVKAPKLSKCLDTRTAKGKGSICLHKDLQKWLNRQAREYLHGYHFYLSLSYFFDRYKIALPGLYKLFSILADKVFDQAEKIFHLIALYRGSITVKEIKVSETCEKIGKELESDLYHHKDPCVCAFSLHSKKRKFTKNCKEDVDINSWNSSRWAMEEALAYNRLQYRSMLKTDPYMHHLQVMHFWKSEILDPQVDIMKNLATNLTQLMKLDNEGIYAFDLTIQQSLRKNMA